MMRDTRNARGSNGSIRRKSIVNSPGRRATRIEFAHPPGRSSGSIGSSSSTGSTLQARCVADNPPARTCPSVWYAARQRDLALAREPQATRERPLAESRTEPRAHVVPARALAQPEVLDLVVDAVERPAGRRAGAQARERFVDVGRLAPQVTD